MRIKAKNIKAPITLLVDGKPFQCNEKPQKLLVDPSKLFVAGGWDGAIFGFPVDPDHEFEVTSRSEWVRR